MHHALVGHIVEIQHMGSGAVHQCRRHRRAATASTKDGLKWVSVAVSADNQDALRSLGSQVLHKVGAGAVVQLGALLDGKVSLVAYCSPEAIKAGQAAGKLIGALTAKLGGKGGGKPDYAQGGGGDASKLAEVLKL